MVERSVRCRVPDLNRHGLCPGEFKSPASTIPPTRLAHAPDHHTVAPQGCSCPAVQAKQVQSQLSAKLGHGHPAVGARWTCGAGDGSLTLLEPTLTGCERTQFEPPCPREYPIVISGYSLASSTKGTSQNHLLVALALQSGAPSSPMRIRGAAPTTSRSTCCFRSPNSQALRPWMALQWDHYCCYQFLRPAPVPGLPYTPLETSSL